MSNSIVQNIYTKELRYVQIPEKACINYNYVYNPNTNQKYKIICDNKGYYRKYKENYQEKEKTKIVIFAHMTNTIQAADWALKLGVNGLEMDLRFDPDTNIPTEFRHSTFSVVDVCDCSLGQERRDNVCKYLNNPNPD